MSVAMFAGTLIGALLALAAQDRRIPVCKYFFGLHPALMQLIGLALVFLLVLIPSLALSGRIAISAPSFFWGGCFAYSFIVSFAMMGLMAHPIKVRKPRFQ